MMKNYILTGIPSEMKMVWVYDCGEKPSVFRKNYEDGRWNATLNMNLIESIRWRMLIRHLNNKKHWNLKLVKF